MKHITRMVCLNCAKTFDVSPTRYVCDKCGIDGILDVEYDYQKISLTVEQLRNNPERSLWRYRPMLPVPADATLPPLQVGWTPLYKADRLEKRLGAASIYVKDDGRNPTASLKDRASAVGVVMAQAAGCKAICCASTGNAASSLSGFAASIGLPAVILVPARAPRAKITQLLIYGAKTILVNDTYDRAFELSVEVAARTGHYNRNCAYNPFLVEGKKTVAFEIWEQLGCKVPDRVYVSLGDGCITSGVYKGFYDLKALGLTDRIPQIVAVQAAGCNPVEVAMKTGKFVEQKPNTIADSIAVGVPRNRLKAMRALKESKGRCISVTDDEIRAALTDLPRTVGVFGEPAGVTAYAGLLKDARDKQLDPQETAVILVTGNGLKDIESAIKTVTVPEPTEPNLDAVMKAVEKK